MIPRFLFPAIMLISATGIAYQVALMRILSIAQWHHFAYMIISISMLGFGASGTALSLFRHRIQPKAVSILRWSALCVTFSLVPVYIFSQSIPFETYQLLSQPGQFRYLLMLYVLLSIPFFLVACCISLSFFIVPKHIGKLYFFNMSGSGLGAILIVGLLYMAPSQALPYLLTLISATACILLMVDAPRRHILLILLPLAAFLTTIFITGVSPIRISEYKGLPYALELPEANVVAERYSPISHITAISSPYLRETPGQLSNYPMSQLGDLPEQVGLYFDAGAVSPVHRFDGNLEDFAYLDYITNALAYRMLEEPHVLVLGAGGGTEVLNALYHNARKVTAVEVDRQVHTLINTYLKDFYGGLYNHEKVSVIFGEGRSVLESSEATYDLIHLPLFGSYTAASAGVMALNESYLYTVEALALFLDRLNPQGILSLSCWLKTPPRDAIKLFATAVEALEYRGVSNPEQHIAFIRSWNNATILVSPDPFTQNNIAAIRQFCAERYFDISYCPGVTDEEVNQYTILEEPYYYDAATAILSEDRATYYRDNLFHIVPATDDNPYFFRFLKWESLPRLIDSMGLEWLPFVEWGYIVLIATLLQSVLVGVVLILLPLLVLARESQTRNTKYWTVLYFGALGTAFMFLEIAFIQVFMRFLGHPIYAVTVVLTAFLVFSGIGSLTSGYYTGSKRALPVVWSVSGILVLSVLYITFLPGIFSSWSGLPDVLKIISSIVLLAPLAFCMGVPFPSGMQLISDKASTLVPWAWGINGCTSVVGATSATFLAIHLGFTILIFFAVAIYLMAAVFIWRLQASL